MAEPSGYLLQNLIIFGRLLRSLGLPVQPSAALDMVSAIGFIDLKVKEEFYYAARSLFVLRKEDLPIFERAFEQFWSGVQPGPPDHPRRAAVPIPSGEPIAGPERTEKTGTPSRPEGRSTTLTLTYSPAEVLRKKDFAQLSEDELDTVKKMMAKFSWNLGVRRSRRWQPGKVRLIDFHRTFRESLRNEGELLRLAQRKPKMRPRPLTILADISGSMERYTTILLYFVAGLVGSLDQPVEAFVFSTRLTRITSRLKGRDLKRTLTEIGASVPDWSGGTRIGEALKTFNFEWSRRVLRHRAIVLLISDGWDRGDVEMLKDEMARLQRSSYRLIWLNPLLGSPEYEPLTRGIRAALPYVDDFLPVHNLVSLEALARHLQTLDDQRPIRRQQITVPSTGRSPESQ